MPGEKRFTLRMDADLFNEISEVAKRHRRSTAKEIEYAIALYLTELAKKELLNNLDFNNMTEEEAKENLKKLNDVFNKYKAFLE